MTESLASNVSHIHEGDFLVLLREKKLGVSPEILRAHFETNNLGLLSVRMGPKKCLRMYPRLAVTNYIAQKDAERTTKHREAEAAQKPVRPLAYDFAALHEKVNLLAETVARQHEIFIAIATALGVAIPAQEVQNVSESQKS